MKTNASVPTREEVPNKAPAEPLRQLGERAQREPSLGVRACRREVGPRKARMKSQPLWRPLP